MIEINLLPEEMRPKERATTPYSALVVGGGTATLAAAVLLGCFYYFTVRDQVRDLAEARSDLKKQEADLLRAEALKKKQQDDIERRDLALKVKGQRALWSGVLDAAWTVVDDLGGFWIESMTLEELKAEAGKKPGPNDGPKMGLSFELSCSEFADGATEYDMVSERRVADFMEAILEHPHIKGRHGLVQGGWARKAPSEAGASRPSLVSVVQIVFQKTALSVAKPAPQKAPPPAKPE